MSVSKFFIIFVIFTFSIFAGIPELRNTISPGLAIAVGDGADDMNPGLNFLLEPVVRIHNFFGLGGQIDYTWLSIDFPASYDVRGGFHFWDASFVPKLYIPIVNDICMFFDVDPGLHLALAYYRSDYYSDRDMEPYFGLTFKTGFNIKQFSVGFKFKSIFEDGEATKWICFNVGYVAI